jgi:hypothetical protein
MEPAAARAREPGHHTPTAHRLFCSARSLDFFASRPHSLRSVACRFRVTQCQRSTRRPAPPCSTLATVLGLATPYASSLRLLGTLRLNARSLTPLFGTYTDARKPRPARARGGRPCAVFTRHGSTPQRPGLRTRLFPCALTRGPQRLAGNYRSRLAACQMLGRPAAVFPTTAQPGPVRAHTDTRPSRDDRPQHTRPHGPAFAFTNDKPNGRRATRPDGSDARHLPI